MMSLFFILLRDKVIYLSIFYDCHFYLYLFICNYLSIYTPSYQHFKAFPLSKFNSETTFLYQLFKEDSNFRVKKPCKVIYLSAYDVFLKPCKIIYLSISFTIHLLHSDFTYDWRPAEHDWARTFLIGHLRKSWLVAR